MLPEMPNTPADVPDEVLSDVVPPQSQLESPQDVRDDIATALGFVYLGCKICVQIQPFGGTYSQFAANGSNGTSYSWRDTTIVASLDCFYKSGAKARAVQWQAVNDQMMAGPDSPYSQTDRRFLWGSYGDWNLKNTWEYYFDDEEQYKQIGRIRAQADPNGTFTPNVFAVERVMN